MIKDICYATDNNYAHLVSVSIISMIQNNSEMKSELCFHIICNDVRPENMERLKQLEKLFNINVKFYDVDMRKYIVRKTATAKWPVTAYARIFLSEILGPEVKRVLYIDCDTIVTGNILPLLSTAVKDNMIIAGAVDFNSISQAERIGLEKPYVYINTGILCIDMEKWREQRLTDRIMEFYDNLKEELIFCDQDLINLSCKDVIDACIDYKYNTGGLISFKPEYYKSKGAVIIHYWGYEYRSRRKDLMQLFYKYYNQSPWAGMKLPDDSTLIMKIRSRTRGWLCVNCLTVYKFCMFIWLNGKRGCAALKKSLTRSN